MKPLKAATPGAVPDAAPAEGPEKRPTPKKTPEQKRAEKLRKREAKRFLDARRPLSSWETYRALHDAFDEGLDLVDLADHKARFAFVIMGALNAGLVLLVASRRSDLFDRVPAAILPWLVAYLILYAGVGVYFFLQAIESLRPRSVRPVVPKGGDLGDDDYPLGVRFFHDVLERDVVSHLKAWRGIRISQLNSELARQAYALARINKLKYRALNRLYVGLKVMTVLAAGLVVFAVVLFLIDFLPAASAARLDVLGAPTRIAASGAQEPSGIAYHAGLKHLFLVGDEGRLVELDGSGRVLQTDAVKGNLEDVAVHTPSGNLVLLSEKKSELIVFDPVTHQEKNRFHMDAPALLAHKTKGKNQGFEGIAFRVDAEQPGGGVFYLVHQSSPAMIVAVAFDPSSPIGAIDGSNVIERFTLPGFKDLNAVTYVPSLSRLLVISDNADRLLVVGLEGELQAEVVLPGHQQEGVSIDGNGDLWVADERDGLLRFQGAERILAAHLAQRSGS